jgi:hypothetical protein
MDANTAFSIKGSLMLLAAGLFFMKYRQMNSKKKEFEVVQK